ncbi:MULTISPECIES: DUF742 domain-containing protein [Protofrankia]|uniref:DUF742 domain-containing protein n=1 Tax=Candidatus Protofrankia datiscae TaxID=2716812 RepID=F8B673_9ACTN|nr:MULTISPECIES: DUF742 domain-containing protein [Protofrankia]AEH08043.1 protein of unknown function DUF742 [Candidatus Protofrankia datiscae]
MDEEWYDDAGPVVRPYAVTGGRTRPAANHALELVALVLTTEHGRAMVRTLDPEQRNIVLLCQSIQSIAEISAQLNLPVGVARVLVGDMIDAGLVRVTRPARPSERPDVALMEKVLDGLQTL